MHFKAEGLGGEMASGLAQCVNATNFYLASTCPPPVKSRHKQGCHIRMGPGSNQAHRHMHLLAHNHKHLQALQ